MRVAGRSSDFQVACKISLAIIRSNLANLDLLTPGGDTALHMAVTVCSTPIVQALVDGHAKLNVHDARSQTALMIAVFKACNPSDDIHGHEARSIIVIQGMLCANVCLKSLKTALSQQPGIHFFLLGWTELNPKHGPACPTPEVPGCICSTDYYTTWLSM